MLMNKQMIKVASCNSIDGIIKGKSIKYNQVLQSAVSQYRTDYTTLTLVDATTNHYKVEITSGTALSSYLVFCQTRDALIYNHKYLIHFEIKGVLTTSSSFAMAFEHNSSMNTTSTALTGVWQSCTEIKTATAETDSDFRTFLRITPYTDETLGDYIEYRNQVVVDLTELFGAGNEPTNVNDFDIGKIVQSGKYLTHPSGIVDGTTPLTFKGVNLFNANRSEGTMTAGWSVATRDFDDKHYYNSLTRDNYYNNSKPVVVSEVSTNKITINNAIGGYGLTFPIKVKPNTTYYFHRNMTNNQNTGIGFYNSSKTYFSNTSLGASTTSFTTPANCYWLTIVFLADTETTYTDIILCEATDAQYLPYVERTYYESILGKQDVAYTPTDDTKNAIYFYQSSTPTTTILRENNFSIIENHKYIFIVNGVLDTNRTGNGSMRFYSTSEYQVKSNSADPVELDTNVYGGIITANATKDYIAVNWYRGSAYHGTNWNTNDTINYSILVDLTELGLDTMTAQEFYNANKTLIKGKTLGLIKNLRGIGTFSSSLGVQHTDGTINANSQFGCNANGGFTNIYQTMNEITFTNGHKYFAYYHTSIADNSANVIGVHTSGKGWLISDSTFSQDIVRNNNEFYATATCTNTTQTGYLMGANKSASAITINYAILIDLTAVGLDSLNAKEFYRLYHTFFDTLANGGTATTIADLFYNASGKFIRKIGSVDLGTLYWSYNSDYLVFSAVLSTSKVYSYGGVVVGLCSKYDVASTAGIMQDVQPNTLMFNHTNKTIRIKDTNYTDATAFTTAMSGVILEYELATETEETLASIWLPINVDKCIDINNVELDIVK